MGNASPIYALQKALAVTRTPALLDSVVEIYIGKDKAFYGGAQIIYKTPYLLFPAITTLVKAIPAMQKLHTIHLTRMVASRTGLYSILSSPYLIHLILDRVQIPKLLDKLPPPKLCQLTLTTMSSWEGVEPLISHLAPSLEYLELQRCEFRALGTLLCPPFSRLRELRHHQSYIRNTVPHPSRLSELFHLGSQITHLHLSGPFHHTRVTAFPKSLRHLSVEAWVLTEQNFRASPLHGLLSLTIERCGPGEGLWRLDDPLTLLPALIRDCFPGIISLQLHIKWSLRNIALVIARFQRNVQKLKLVIETTPGLDYHEERDLGCLLHQEDISTAYFCGSTLPAPLQSLSLDVIQTRNELEWSVAPCITWVNNDTLPSVTGLGGPDLKSIDASFIRPESKLVPGRILRMQWAQSTNGDWEMGKCLE